MPNHTTYWRSSRRAGRAYSPPTSPERRLRGVTAALVVALFGAGCAPQLAVPEDPLIAPEALLRGEILPGASQPLPDLDLLATDATMRAFVARHVDPRASAERRLRQLLDALLGADGVGVEYRAETDTAAAAFHRREANCLSFTAMFVALAREAGLAASFQEVDIPPEWTRSGESFVLNRHVDALVGDGTGGQQVIDFNIEDFRASYDRRRISDARALAHFYSNLGVERLQAGELPQALRHFRKSIEQDDSFAPAWVNLGSLYLRAGQTQWAISAWAQALDRAPGEAVALSNLERVYRSLGSADVADQLRARIERHRMGNPYYRFNLAREAFERADYGAAIGHLRYATREKPGEERFAALLALSYLRAGNATAAGRWLARAAEIAGDEAGRRGYLDELAKLRASG